MNTMKAKDEESRTLAAIRDALLSRLISGELRVEEAERMVEEAVPDSGDTLNLPPPARIISGQSRQNLGVRTMSWQLQEAKQRFSELVRRAEKEGPQVVTRHGEEVVVVVPAEEFRRMSGHDGEKMSFKEFLMSAPEGLEMIIPERPRDDYPREVDLGFEDPEA